eukprot:6650003-Prorocentrum_lima.AAC.1
MLSRVAPGFMTGTSTLAATRSDAEKPTLDIESKQAQQKRKRQEKARSAAASVAKALLCGP